MPYLLDSDIVIYHLAGDLQATALLNRLFGAGLAMSVVTMMEVLDGLTRSASPQTSSLRFEQFAQAVPILPFLEAEARRCAAIRNHVRKQGRSVRSRALDLMIAATAIEHDLILATNNAADYRDIPGLRIESLT